MQVKKIICGVPIKSCVDLASVAKIAKILNIVHYLLVHLDLFGRNLEAKGMKTTDSEKMMKKFGSKIYFNDKQCESNSKAAGKQLHSTRIGTKAAFAEHSTWSLKYVLFRYMEYEGYVYIHNFAQLDTTHFSEGKCSIELMPKQFMHFDLFAHS